MFFPHLQKDKFNGFEVFPVVTKIACHYVETEGAALTTPPEVISRLDETDSVFTLLLTGWLLQSIA